MAPRIISILLALLSLQSFAQEQGKLIRPPPAWPTAAQHSEVGPLEQPAAARQTPAVARQTEEGAATPDTAAVNLEPGNYTVQVAAFREADAARAALAQQNVAGLRLVQSRRNGEDWYLLILGVFPTHQAAVEAETSYLQANPQGSSWIRSTDSIK